MWPYLSLNSDTQEPQGDGFEFLPKAKKDPSSLRCHKP